MTKDNFIEYLIRTSNIKKDKKDAIMEYYRALIKEHELYEVIIQKLASNEKLDDRMEEITLRLKKERRN